MKCLFLDLASHDALVACVTDDTVVASESVHTKVSDAELIPLIEGVLNQAAWAYDDITQIACVIGPGGFTSLRVGVTFTNVLADQLGVPVAGIHLSDLYYARAKTSNIYWLHSTKKQQLFVRGGEWNEPTLISTEEIQSGSWVGELIEEHRALVSQDAEPLVATTDILPDYLSAQSYQKTLLEPWYGRGW